MPNTTDATYQSLCSKYYDADKTVAPDDALKFYLAKADHAKGKILEPMCGSGRFLLPLLQRGYDITGFDTSEYMLQQCENKAKEQRLITDTKITKSNFANYKYDLSYQLIMIPSGSFCLLSDAQATEALSIVHKVLDEKGTFIVEIDTINCKQEEDYGIWSGKWIDLNDNSKIVLSCISSYDEATKIEKTITKYELWENNVITKTEVEDFNLRLYKITEMEKLLLKHKFRIVRKIIPYTNVNADENATSVLFECTI